MRVVVGVDFDLGRDVPKRTKDLQSGPEAAS